MNSFVIPINNYEDIACKLFIYTNDISKLIILPVIIYFYSDSKLEEHINFCNELSTQSYSHVIMIQDLNFVCYRESVMAVIDFVHINMNVPISNIILFGRRWATNIATYGLTYLVTMYNEHPSALILVFPERYDEETVFLNLLHCKKTTVLLIDDQNNEYSEKIKEYINNISQLTLPTYTNYITNTLDINRDIITPCKYVIRAVNINNKNKYELPSDIIIEQEDIKEKQTIKQKLLAKYAEMKKLLS